jgi:ribosomal protein L40E
MYLFVLWILLFVITAPPVIAQTTSISNLQYPSKALLGSGKDIVVTFTVTYSLGYSGFALAAGILDMDAGDYAAGTASSSPETCVSTSATLTGRAVCGFIPAAATGSTEFSFNLRFYGPGTYRLRVVAAMADYSGSVLTNSFSTQDFTIQVTDKVSLTIRAPDGVTVTIDGAQQNSGNVFTNVNLGTHTISVPDMVNVDSGTRLRFDRWADGFSLPTRTVNLQDDATFEATYVTQYSLTLESPQGSPTGAGWYDEGTSAQFSVPPTQPMSGVLGSLGGKWAFQGWYEGQSLVNKSSSASITMDRAHSLTARWAADYMIPLVVIGVIAGAVLVGITVIFLRRRRPTLTPQPVQVEPTPVQPQVSRTVLSDKQFCLNCGAELPLKSKFCNKCGFAQS